ncbi:MAG: hypothetical protein Fur005_26470 [Roseiflexaceae bacterium]
MCWRQATVSLAGVDHAQFHHSTPMVALASDNQLCQVTICPLVLANIFIALVMRAFDAQVAMVACGTEQAWYSGRHERSEQ